MKIISVNNNGSFNLACPNDELVMIEQALNYPLDGAKHKNTYIMNNEKDIREIVGVIRLLIKKTFHISDEVHFILSRVQFEILKFSFIEACKIIEEWEFHTVTGYAWKDAQKLMQEFVI